MNKLKLILESIIDNYWYIVFICFSILTLTADSMLAEFASMILATIALAVIEIKTLIKDGTHDKSN